MCNTIKFIVIRSFLISLLLFASITHSIPTKKENNYLKSGAGVLPFVRHKRGLYFLFSVDYHRQAGKKNKKTGDEYTKDQYADFGGSAEKHHKTFEEIATDEGYEETSGVLSGTWKKPFENKRKGKKYLRKKVEEASEKGWYITLLKGEKTFVTYFIDVTDIVKNDIDRLEILSKLYKATAANLKKFRENRDTHGIATKDNPYAFLCEKRVFMWFSEKQFKKAISGDGPFEIHIPFRENLQKNLRKDWCKNLKEGNTVFYKN